MKVRLPEAVALELTYQCNHRCDFCSCPWEAGVSMEPELTVGEWIVVMDKLVSLGVDTVTFTGGEPLLKEGLVELVEHARTLGVNICLISNGRAMTAEMLGFLHRNRVSLSMSVPGIETFELQTGYDGVEHVMAMFRECRRIGMKATANITASKVNLHELYETAAYSIVNGADYILLNRFLPGGRGLSHERYLLTVDETNKAFEIVERVLAKAGKHGHVGTELPYCLVRNHEKFEYLRMSFMCGATKTFFVIDPSGYVKVCNHSERRLCAVDDIESLETDGYWNMFARRRYRPSECGRCDMASRCDGGCRESANVYLGDARALDPCFVISGSECQPV